MNLRDLKPSVLRRLAAEGENEFAAWFKLTEGKQSGKNYGQPVPLNEVFRWAFSKGASAVLRRVDKLKDDL